MVAVIIKNVFYRVILPISLISAALIRPSFISTIYALLALSNLLFPRIRGSYPLSTATKAYLTVTVIISLITSIGQLVYQVSEHILYHDDQDYVKDCRSGETWRYWFRQFGFTRVPKNSIIGFRHMLPEVISIISSLVTLVVCLTRHDSSDLNEQPRAITSQHSHPSTTGSAYARQVNSHQKLIDAIKPSVQRLSDILLTLFTVFVGIIQPCLLNSTYFVIFLILMTWYSLYKPIGRDKFNTFKKFLIGYSGVHILILYLYQIECIKDLLNPDGFVARLIGLTDLASSVNCVEWWDFTFNSYWTAYVNFGIIWVYYYCTVTQYKWTRTGIRSHGVLEDDSSSDHEELLPSSSDVEHGPNSIPLQRITSAVLDRQKISIIFRRPGEGMTPTKEGLTALTYFCLHHFYVIGLIAMMTWALLYHSVFGLILLFTACVIWALRDSRKWCFKISPLLLLYIEFLLIVQYIYSLDLIAEKEIPVNSVLSIIGFQIAASRSAAFLTLSVKVLLSLPFFVILRLELREKFYDSLSDHDRRKRLNYGTFSQLNSPRGHRLTNASTDIQKSPVFEFISHFLTKYWIFVVAFVILVNALSSPPVDYTVGYLILWCLLILLLNISFGVFRRLVFIYWTLVIVYSSLLLLAVYTYQFPSVPEFWQEKLGWSAETFAKIGLVDYRDEHNSHLLFVRLLLPVLVVLTTMLQLKFFHDPWAKLVQTPAQSEDGSASETEDSNTARTALQKLKRTCRDLAEVLWRLAEVHLIKLILLILILTAASHICVLNFVLVVFVSVALCIPSLSGLISLLLTVYLALSTVARVVYSIHTKNSNNTLQFNDGECPEIDFNGTSVVPVSQWLGLENIRTVFERDIVGLVLLLVTIAIQLSVKYRQRHYRRLRGLPEPESGIIFPGEDGQYIDKSVIHCIKFMFNYFFYKFGLEMCIIMMGIVAWVRMDLLGLLVVVWLLIFVSSSRRITRALWPIFLLYLAIMLPLQYAMWVGLPQDLCILYPWSHWLVPDPGTSDGTLLSNNLLKLLDLANYREPINPNAKQFLVADFFLVLFVAAQERVFRKESSSHPGGDNFSIYTSGDYTLRRNNPRYDFITNQRTYVDYFKIAIFMYGHWFTLVMVLVAGLGGTSLFALGYMILAFSMLWQGNNLYTMKNYKRTLCRWNFILMFTVVVILSKIATQALGCVFLKQLDNLCFVRQLFSIVCVDKSSADNILSFNTSKQKCYVDRLESMIGYDTFALIFLVFQIRILHSWYFQHCILDFRCEIVQSSRGALLINQLIEKEMKEQNIQQQAKFDEIRTRTAAIRRQYEDQQRRTSVATFDAKTYGQAKRAGDYYMFNYEPDVDELVAPIETFVPEVTPGASDFNKLDPAQLLHTAISKDMDLQGTLNAVETAEKIKDEEERMIKAVVKEEDEDDEGKEKEGSDFMTNVFRFMGKICKSGLEWLTAFLNRRSREHRYVAYVLNKEKTKLKNEMNQELYNVNISMKEFREQWEGRSMHLVASESDVSRLEDEAASKGMERHLLARFILALGYCIAAHTDIIAYFFACFAHAIGSGLITLPLPALIFFWGTLASPRPSKNFWVVLITYTQIEIIIKFIFQFGFWPWNTVDQQLNEVNSITIRSILGIQKASYFAFWDVVFLISLFFHRYMLRRLGLWKDANIMDTFIEAPLQNIQSSPIEENKSDDQIDTIPPEERGIISSFIYKLFHPKFRYIRDLYPLMFFLDVICFFIVVFGFSSFGDGGTGSVINDLTANKVPITFVVLLFVISLMIVIDRGLYLRKAVFSKLIYQLVTVIAIHIWIFFVLPYITKIPSKANKMAQFLYVVKCIYFIVSAWQIRNGYPQLCIGNLLTHSYGLINMVLFKIFMACPFLFELRTAIDWTWTDTSMPILDFFSMENFYSVIYNLKCARTFEQAFPAPKGIPKGAIVKYSIGIPLILAIILIIWFPLLAYALLNRIGTSLAPEKVELSLSLEGYPAIFTMEAQGYEIIRFDENNRTQLKNVVSDSINEGDILTDDMMRMKSRIRRAISFVDDYEASDIYRVKFRPVSEVVWTISDDSMAAMKYQLKAENKIEDKSIRLNAHLALERYREGSKEPVKHTSTFSFNLKPDSEEWNGLGKALDVKVGSSSETVEIPNILPFFMVIPNEGEIKPADVLFEPVLRREKVETGFPDVVDAYSSLVLRLIKANDAEGTMVWNSQAKSNKYLRLYKEIMGYDAVKYDTTSNSSYIEAIIFVDKVFPDLLLRYAQGGVVAMYLALVLLIGRSIRGVIANQPLDVIINEIPNPDHLLKICLDIYLVREAKDFVLEQDMYAKLIFLFRSPATLIKWTRYKPKQE